MRALVGVVRSMVAVLSALLAVAGLACVVLMVRAHGSTWHETALLGTVAFTSAPAADGGVDATCGIVDVRPLLVLSAVLGTAGFVARTCWLRWGHHLGR